jgi:hypothetical protein
MMSRLLWVVVLVAALAATAFAQMEGSKSAEKGKSNETEQKLSQMEKDLWEAWKNHDVEPFKKAMAAQSVNVGSDGVVGTDQALKDLGSSTCNGQKVPGSVWASSLWVNKDKQWKAAFHQETPAQSAMEKKSE